MEKTGIDTFSKNEDLKQNWILCHFCHRRFELLSLLIDTITHVFSLVITGWEDFRLIVG